MSAGPPPMARASVELLADRETSSTGAETLR